MLHKWYLQQLLTDPTLDLCTTTKFLDIYIEHIFLILNFTFEKNVHFNKLTKATHASYLERKWKGYLIKLKAHSFRSPTG